MRYDDFGLGMKLPEGFDTTETSATPATRPVVKRPMSVRLPAGFDTTKTPIGGGGNQPGPTGLPELEGDSRVVAALAAVDSAQRTLEGALQDSQKATLAVNARMGARNVAETAWDAAKEKRRVAGVRYDAIAAAYNKAVSNLEEYQRGLRGAPDWVLFDGIMQSPAALQGFLQGQQSLVESLEGTVRRTKQAYDAALDSLNRARADVTATDTAVRNAKQGIKDAQSNVAKARATVLKEAVDAANQAGNTAMAEALRLAGEQARKDVAAAQQAGRDALLLREAQFKKELEAARAQAEADGAKVAAELANAQAQQATTQGELEAANKLLKDALLAQAAAQAEADKLRAQADAHAHEATGAENVAGGCPAGTTMYKDGTCRDPSGTGTGWAFVADQFGPPGPRPTRQLPTTATPQQFPGWMQAAGLAVVGAAIFAFMNNRKG